MGTRVTPSAIHFADKALAGVPRLLDDLQRLVEDRETADIVFIVGREEVPIYAHRLILRARCTSFQNVKRGEICKVPGSTVSPAPPGTPTPIRLPHAKPEVFREVLFYLYTGKVILQDCTVFESLSIAQELGIDELRMCCEDHINSTLNVHNACTFLPACLEMENRVPGNKSGRSFLDRCTAYIGENAMECVKTSAFLNLPKDALIHLVSSDYLAMEEEDVWRAVLAWAKHQAGVTQPTAHWTEEERARITQQMSGVINYVRILLIDSQVFAEEVEPTGAVPMELSLESKWKSKRSEKKFDILIKLWIIFHLEALVHNFENNFGSHGELCGGFSDVPWGKTRGRGRYVPSDKAFLFTLINNADVPPTKFEVVKKMFAIAPHPEYGPIFGAGADLCISHNCNANLESYSNLPHSYDGENASCTLLMGDYNFTVLDYEVFTTLGK
ncbi:BTB/POZ domain-containing protein 19 [Argiope bruennichi]|uniref:BTB/POZ domain-containing protein 19 n=1 Tax=Argiope bruennichi TaxID=94029 RepID=A0A8T0EHW0_ARGBR|nr:BTB/POZ domain-containing protein 19 [Argiope bruennichi]